MMVNRNLMLVLTISASAMLAAFFAVLAVQRRARLFDADQNRNDLQRWENETGSFAPAAATTPSL